jgi:hypothetical protein
MDNLHERKEKPGVEVTIGAESKWEVTNGAKPIESPLCSVCRVVLETLRGPNDLVSTPISLQIRAQAGCHLCALFLKYSKLLATGANTTADPDLLCKYSFEEADLGQVTIYLDRFEVGEGPNPTKHSETSLGCVPLASKQSLLR